MFEKEERGKALRFDKRVWIDIVNTLNHFQKLGEDELNLNENCTQKNEATRIEEPTYPDVRVQTVSYS